MTVLVSSSETSATDWPQLGHGLSRPWDDERLSRDDAIDDVAPVVAEMYHARETPEDTPAGASDTGVFGSVYQGASRRRWAAT